MAYAKNDSCIAKRRDGEPAFTLLGRDPLAASIVSLWAYARNSAKGQAAKPTSPEKLLDAAVICEHMEIYCRDNGGESLDVLDLLPVEALQEAIRRRGVTG